VLVAGVLVVGKSSVSKMQQNAGLGGKDATSQVVPGGSEEEVPIYDEEGNLISGVDGEGNPPKEMSNNPEEWSKAEIVAVYRKAAQNSTGVKSAQTMQMNNGMNVKLNNTALEYLIGWAEPIIKTVLKNNTIEFDGYSNVEFNKITNLYWEEEEQAVPIQEVDDLHAPPTIKYLSNVKLMNCIVRDYYITHDIAQEQIYSSLPNWDNYTILRADFDYNLRAGNVDWLLNSINKIKVKRRKIGAKETYVTLYEQPISTVYDLSFYYRDYYAPSGYEYEYAMVPCVGSNEQAYFTTTVVTKFDGLFISDKDKTMKLYGNVLINASNDNILLGVLQPYNQTYPIIIKNPNVQYRTVTLQGDVLGLSDNDCQAFELTPDTRPIIVNQKREWDKFLCNGKAKIIKDWNGNIILGKITTAPQYTYTQESGSSKPTMTFGVTEVGDYDNQWYLYHHGLVDVEST
jgi:hypothetical protein